jgi:PAS domain S-box-containing protein
MGVRNGPHPASADAEPLPRARGIEDPLRRFSFIFEDMPDAIVVSDVEGRVVDMNTACERMTGRSRSEALGRPVEFLAGLEHEDRLREEIGVALASAGRWAGVVPIRRAGGSEGSAELVVVPLHDDEGRMVGAMGVNRDITDRLRTEERLRETIEELRRVDRSRRQLLSRLVAAQEEERQRIAAELHDDPIQQLYAAGLRLGMLQARLDEPAAEILEQVQEVLRGTIGRLREMLFELLPRALEADGLGAAVGQYIEYANRESSTEYVLEDRLTIPLSREIRSIAYRNVLEGISNVRRHASARTATIRIDERQGGVSCSIVDDGRGFLMNDLVDRHRPGHIGLPAMRERVELCGGRMDIDSAPGRGTTVEFWLPSS